jgi:hypothetical protein
MRETTLALCALLAACGPAPRHDGSGDDDDTLDAYVGNNGCAMGTESIYTIDQFNYRLSRFDPATKAFMDLGPLSCPSSGGGTPFSMSVDRQANAWVLYNTGELFRVALAGLQCTKTTWSSPSLKVFGMGFSTDEPGGQAETLFVGGGQNQTQSSYTLAKLNLASMAATPIGMQPQLPEMTGTGNAELWGFMPAATMSKIVKFDKMTGAAITTYDEPSLSGTMTGYAFAHWGGDFWVFLIKNNEPSTTVYQVDGMTGAIKGTTPTMGRTIVGAGVSTCAPVVIL